MKEQGAPMGLSSSQGTPALVGVKATGRLDGLVLQMRWLQSYRNPHAQPLEVVYTFPLPAGAVLLEFASELQGRRQLATVVERSKGEARYEEALALGDAPVLLESRPDGLHTANIGNLKPGEEIALEIRFAIALAPEQGRLRVAFPATIAPRYGNPAAAGLQPQQVPLASLSAEYGLALSLTLGASLADAELSCPTHKTRASAVEGGVEHALEGSAWLDRDVVFIVKPREAARSTLLIGEDRFDPAAPVVALAALMPPPQPPRERIVVKLLVDCSGSMAGDSIGSAVRALHGALEALGPDDEVSLSCFGSEVQHRLALGTLTSARRLRLGAAIEAIRADLGGTEMDGALRAVYALGKGSTEDGIRDVLLVTDGECWQADSMIEAARAGGHRIFAIGVGSAPAEGVLRKLAEATGGACEFATPGEALEAAAVRMLARMRQRPCKDLQVLWDGAQPQWQAALPLNAFGGDALLAYAGFAPGTPRPRSACLVGTAQQPIAEAAAAPSPLAGDTLARLAAAHRLARIAYPEREAALALALAYQVPCPHTVSVLVHDRAAEDKVNEPAQVHRVPSMLAAGYGATSTVAPASAMRFSVTDLMAAQPMARPSMARTRSASTAVHPPAAAYTPSTLFDTSAPLPAAPASIPPRPAVDFMDPLRYGDVDFCEPPPPPPPPPPGPATLAELALAAAERIRQGRIDALPALLDRLLQVIPTLHGALVELERAGIERGTAVLLIAAWVNARAGGLGDTVIAAALAPHVGQVDAAEVALCNDCFERRLGTGAPVDWAAVAPPPPPSSRARRLAAALGLGRGRA